MLPPDFHGERPMTLEERVDIVARIQKRNAERKAEWLAMKGHS